MFRITAAIILLAAPAHSQSYDAKKAVRLFRDQPCTQAIAVIDAPFPEMTGNDVRGWAKMAATHMAQQGQAWGFILGYDAAKKGLSSKGRTTLERLRASCAVNPRVPALRLLESFSD